MKLVIEQFDQSQITRVFVEMTGQDIRILPAHITAMTKALGSGKKPKKSDVLFVLSEIARFIEQREDEMNKAAKKSADA